MGNEGFSAVTGGSRRLFVIYQWGKPQPQACRGECGGGKNPPQINRRKKTRLGASELKEMPYYPFFYDQLLIALYRPKNSMPHHIVIPLMDNFYGIA